jgi:hypothetical protein
VLWVSLERDRIRPRNRRYQTKCNHRPLRRVPVYGMESGAWLFLGW